MQILSRLIFFALVLLPLPASAIPAPPIPEWTPDFLDRVESLFPEGREVAPELLDFEVDPNLRLFQEAEISVSFVGEAATYQNSFGYFLYEDLNEDGLVSNQEILRREILFPNATGRDSGGDLRPGDTRSLGKFPAGTRIGFYLIADGFVEERARYYTRDELNPEGQRHLAMLALPDRHRIVLGIEDLPMASGDRDFNDLLFTIQSDPKEALAEAIEEANIPVAEPPAQVASPPEPSPTVTRAGAGETREPLQQSAGTPYLEGGGLGCQISRQTQLDGFSLLHNLMFLASAYFFWKRYC